VRQKNDALRTGFAFERLFVSSLSFEARSMVLFFDFFDD
jgi:hypothetical protein